MKSERERGTWRKIERGQRVREGHRDRERGRESGQKETDTER